MGEKLKHGQEDKILPLLETGKRIKQQGETASRRERGGKDRLTTTFQVPRKTTQKKKWKRQKYRPRYVPHKITMQEKWKRQEFQHSSCSAENQQKKRVEKEAVLTLFMFRTTTPANPQPAPAPSLDS